MTQDVYRAPQSEIANDEQPLNYAGFWVRFAASLVDSILSMALILPLLHVIYGKAYWQSEAFIMGGWDVLLNYVLPAVVIILFWVYKSATPGKMLCGLLIVSTDGGKPSTAQLVGRYFAYYVSLLPFGLGFIWVAFDKRKQGWHDKLAGTIVVKK